MIALRGRIGTLTMATLRPAVDLKQMEVMVALPDLLAHVRVDGPADAQTRDTVVKMIGAQIDASLAKETKLTTVELVECCRARRLG